MSSYTKSSVAPSELDYLVQTLRSPSSSLTVQNVLSYLYNYIPYVKHEHNLRIVIASFLNNPVCFGTKLPSYKDNYLIIEVFKLIIEKKLKVSQPTLSIKAFYNVLGRELRNFVSFNPAQNSWKVLPIIAGISLSNDLRDQLLSSFVEYGWGFSAFDNSMHSLFAQSLQNSLAKVTHDDISNLSLISLALNFRPSENLKDYIGAVDTKLVIEKLMTLLYGTKGGAQVYKYFSNCGHHEFEQIIKEEVLQNPVTKHLSRLSFLLEALFQNLEFSQVSFDLIIRSVTLMLEFDKSVSFFTESQAALNKELDNSDEADSHASHYWFLMKSILFSQIVIIQGIVSRFMSVNNAGALLNMFRSRDLVTGLECEYRDICYSILNCLFHLNFILLSIGQGGFDGYNFVYYVGLELVLKNNVPSRFEYNSRCLIGNYEVNLHPQNLNLNYVARCKVLFVLGMWENYLQQAPVKDEAFLRYVYSTTLDIIEDPCLEHENLYEAGHSVMLSYFSRMDNNLENLQRVLHYFELLVSQFPSKLSAHQLSVAVETLGKKIMTHSIAYTNSFYGTSIDEFLSVVYDKCLNTVPGQRLKNAKIVLFNSAQPVSEIDANSTMSQLGEHPSNTNIIDDNKGDKPKDMAYIDVVSTVRHDPVEHFSTRETPNTSREGIVMAFFNIVPYLPMSIFVRWLNKAWSLILSSNKDEQIFLIDKLWKCLSENLDLNRSEVAYEWWFESLRAAEMNVGHKPTLFKL